MQRTLALATVALASVACSQPQPAATRPQVRPDPTAQVAAAPTNAPTGTPTPQPAEPSAHPAVAVAQPVPAAPGTPGTRHFGDAIETGLPSVHLGQILAAPGQYNNHAVRVEGQVVAVCQHMGCWMEIRDEQTQAHIRMHGHAFFLPRDVNGHRAAVEATLVAAHAPTECDQHAQAAAGATAQAAPIELDATGVDVYD